MLLPAERRRGGRMTSCRCEGHDEVDARPLQPANFSVRIRPTCDAGVVLDADDVIQTIRYLTRSRRARARGPPLRHL